MGKTSEDNNIERVFEKRGKGHMNIFVKVMITLAGIGCIGCIVYGVNTYNTAKENEVQQAAQVVQIEMNDSTVKSETEKVVEETVKQVDYSKEAEKAFGKSGLSAEYKEQFMQAYIKYRKQGVDADVIYNKLMEKFNQEKTSGVMGNAAGDQAEIEDEYDQAYQDQLDAEAKEAEIVEEVEQPEFQVLLLDETVKYAKKPVNIRKGPGTTYDKVGGLTTNQEVTVIGLVPDSGSGWYQLIDENDEVIGYVSASYLVDEKVTVQETKPPVQESTQTQPEQPAAPAPSTSTGTTPNGTKLGRSTVTRGDGSGQGGSGRGNNATYG